MSEQTTPDPEAPRPSEEHETADDGVSQGAAAGTSESFWRRVPLWGWITAGVVVVAGAVVAILAATGAFTPEPLPTPPAATVTAEPPTPTAEPIEREVEPTAFSAALPDSVLDLVLADMSEGGQWAEDGAAIEAYALSYSDGGARNVELSAAQFADEEAAQAALPEVLMDAETGEVTADGAVVGEFWIVPGSPEDVSRVLWRNTTAVFVLEGDEELVRDVFRAFPL